MLKESRNARLITIGIWTIFTILFIGGIVSVILFYNAQLLKTYQITSGEISGILKDKANTIEFWRHQKIYDTKIYREHTYFSKVFDDAVNHGDKQKLDRIKKWMQVFEAKYHASVVYMLDKNMVKIDSAKSGFRSFSQKSIYNLFPQGDKHESFVSSFKLVSPESNTEDYIISLSTIRNNKKVCGYILVYIEPFISDLAEVISWPLKWEKASLFVTYDNYSDDKLKKHLHNYVYSREDNLDEYLDGIIKDLRADSTGLYKLNIEDDIHLLVANVDLEGTDNKLTLVYDLSEEIEDVKSARLKYLIGAALFLTLLGILQFELLKRKTQLYNLIINWNKQKTQSIETRYQTLIKYANDIFLLLDETGTIVECNQAALNTYEYTQDELVGNNISVLLCYENEGQPFVKQLNNKDSMRLVVRHVTKSGKIIPVEVSSKWITIEDKTYLQFIARDISERIAYERSIVRINILYAYLSEINQIVLQAESDTDLLEELGNVTATKMPDSEYCIAELKGDFSHVINSSFKLPDDGFYLPLSIANDDFSKPGVYAITKGFELEKFRSLLPLRSRNNLKNVVVIKICNSGDFVGMLVLFNQDIIDESGQDIVIFEEISSDVSFALMNQKVKKAQHYAELKLKESERKLFTIMDNIKGVVYRGAFDASRTMEFLSKGFHDLTGYEVESVINNNIIPFQDLIYLPDSNFVRTKIAEAIENHDNFEIKYRIKTNTSNIKWVLERGSTIWVDGELKGLEGLITDISQQKLAEETIVRSRDFYQYLLNKIPALIWKSDDRGKVDYFNETWLKFTGVKPEQQYGDRWLNLIHPEDREKFLVYFKAATEIHEVIEVELRLKHHDGNYRWIKGICRPIKNIDDQFIGYMGTYSDVNQSKELMIELDNNVRKFKELFENNPQPIIVFDITTYRIISVNKASLLKYKFSRDEFSHLLFTELYSPDDQDKLDKLQERLLEQSKGKFHEKGHTHYNKNGKRINVEIVGHPIEFDESDQKLWLVVLQDMTERFRAENLLKESEKRFKSIFENSSIGMARFSITGEIQLANPALVKMMGYKTFYEMKLYNTENPKNLKQGVGGKILDITLTKGEVKGFETGWIRHIGDLIYIRINSRLIKPEDKENYIEVSVENITGKKEAERALLEAKDKAIKSDELKSSFLAKMSHEIRTPVGAIQNFGEFLIEKYENEADEDVKTGLEAINSGCKRVVRTIDLILNMSQIETGTYETVKSEVRLIKDIIEKVIERHEDDAFSKGLFLEWDAGNVDYLLYCDRHSTEEIFEQIMDNAIKYTQFGAVKIFVKFTNGELSVRFKDTGVGISEQYKESLYEPFSQERDTYTREYDGNGLGLALAKRYCELNDYTLEINSIKNVGTVVSVKIPEQKIVELLKT